MRNEKQLYITIPEGTYYVGDVCYAFTDQDRWMNTLEATCYFSAEYEGEKWDGRPLKLDNGLVWAKSTAHGDGGYMGSDGFEYGVDTGLLGIISADIAQDSALYAMKKIEVTKSNNDIHYDGEGNFNICGIEINTDGSTGEYCGNCGCELNEWEADNEYCEGCDYDINELHEEEDGW